MSNFDLYALHLRLHEQIQEMRERGASTAGDGHIHQELRLLSAYANSISQALDLATILRRHRNQDR